MAAMYEGTVENGQLRLADSVKLPERLKQPESLAATCCVLAV